MFKFSLEQWRMKDFIRFNDVVQAGDFKQMFEIFAGVTESWAFDSDPHLPESYGELTFAQFAELQKEFAAEMKKVFSN